jgi:uncharacterized RDD family membrane protein YckC
MQCSSCGATVADGTAFCGSCGRPVVGYSVGGPAAVAAVGGGAIATTGAAGIATPVPTVAPRTVTYAGFWLRFVALIIDSIILGVPFVVIEFAMVGSGMAFMHPGDPAQMLVTILPRLFLLEGVAIVGTWLYSALMESSSWQATLGKKALGIYVTDMEGRRISFGRASARYFSKIISGLIFYIGFIMAGFTEKKQALHDMIASCLVLRSS